VARQAAIQYAYRVFAAGAMLLLGVWQYYIDRRPEG